MVHCALSGQDPMYGIEQGPCVYVGGRSLTGLAESEPEDDGAGAGAV